MIQIGLVNIDILRPVTWTNYLLQGQRTRMLG